MAAAAPANVTSVAAVLSQAAVADTSSLEQLVAFVAATLPAQPALIQSNVLDASHASTAATNLTANDLQPTLSSVPAVLTPGTRDSSSMLPLPAPTHALPVDARHTPSVVHGMWAAAFAAVTPNSSGEAVFKTSALLLDSDSITATYAGDTNFDGSSGSLPMTINASMAIASLAVQHASVSLPASGINDAAIASLLAEWSQDDLDASESLTSALSA